MNQYFRRLIGEGIEEIPSERQLTLYAKTAIEHGLSSRNLGYLGKLLNVPIRERNALRFIRGSPNLHKISLNNLTLLHKHKNLFKNSSHIHNMFINRTTGSSSKNRNARLMAQMTHQERFLFSSLSRLNRHQHPLTKMPMNHLQLLNKYRELIPNGDYVHRVFTERSTSQLSKFQQSELKQAARNLGTKATRVNVRQALEAQRIVSGKPRQVGVIIAPIAPSRNATRLNLTMPHFNAALISKRINDENVQNVLRILKAYRQTKRPKENNAPNRPTKPTTTNLENMKRYRKELANYNSMVRNWMKSMASAWKRNNP